MKTKMHNKRAVISGEMLMVIPKVFFLIAILFAFIILVKALIVTEVDVKHIESSILVNRLLFSKNGISYYDESIERLYPGVIDFNRFEEISKNNPNILDNEIITYGVDNPMIAAKITLKQEDKKDVIAYYNKDKFDRWEPRVLPGIEGGAGSVRAFKQQKYVLVKNEEIISKGNLSFFIIN